MSFKRITVDIPPDHTKARVKVAVEGCTGESCKDLTEAIETALGTQSSLDHAPEYFQREHSNEHQQPLSNG